MVRSGPALVLILNAAPRQFRRVIAVGIPGIFPALYHRPRACTTDCAGVYTCRRVLGKQAAKLAARQETAEAQIAFVCQPSDVSVAND